MSGPLTLMEFGWVLDDGTYLCFGCAVRDGHRCHRGDGAWADGRSCDCQECKLPAHLIPMAAT